MEASWQPDPTGRHQYRWWDGATWSDVVADDGIESGDPFTPPSAKTVISVSTTPTPRVVAAPRPAAGDEDPWTVEIERPRAVDGTDQAARIAATNSVVARYEAMPPPRLMTPGRWAAVALVLAAVLGAAAYLVVSAVSGPGVVVAPIVTSGELTGPGSFVVRDIRLTRGEGVRIRVEGSADADPVTYLLAPRATADKYASQYVTDFSPKSGFSDPAALYDTFTDAKQMFTERTLRDAVNGYVVVKDLDQCCKGVPDAGAFVASAPGVYRILVIEASGHATPLRILVEGYATALTTYRGLTHAFTSDAFFTDQAFFHSSGTYRP